MGAGSGESLLALLARGPMPLHRVLDLAAQIAEGLAAVHAAGGAHGGLTPERVIVTGEGRVRILEPTRVEEGSPVSPEQAAGGAADFRSDQFALGLLLSEMLEGRHPFARGSPQQTTAAILEADAPPLTRAVPTRLRWVLERCLDKDPSERYASTSDLAYELREIRDQLPDAGPGSGEVAAVASVHGRHRAFIVAAGAALLALLGLNAGRVSINDAGVDLRRCRLSPLATPGGYADNPCWSPDGNSIAYVTGDLFVQQLDAPAANQLNRPPLWFMPGDPVGWTPDSRTIYCTALMGDEANAVYRIPAGGGDATVVQEKALFAAISPDGRTLLTFAADSGAAKSVLWYASPPDAPRRRYEPAPDAWQGGFDFVWPFASFAPNGSQICVAIPSGAGYKYWLLPWPPGRGRRVFEGLGTCAGLSWMPDSRHLVISAQPDPAQPMRLVMADSRSGRFWPLLAAGAHQGSPSVSPDGSRVVFATGLTHRDVLEVPLRGGRSRAILASSRNERHPALSADGTQLVYIGDPHGPSEVWSRNMRDGSLRRLLAPSDIPGAGLAAGASGNWWSPGPLSNPELSPDGRRLVVTADIRGTGSRLFIVHLPGGVPVRATAGELGEEMGGSWSPDGRHLVYLVQRKGPGFSLAITRPGGDEPPSILLDSLSNAIPEWSPTGEWIAVCGDGGTVLISPDGRSRREFAGWAGAQAWARDGRTLYGLQFAGALAGRITAIDVPSNTQRVVGDLRDRDVGFAPFGQRISVTRDGTGLLIGSLQNRCELWLLDGLQVPRPWYARLWPWGAQNTRVGTLGHQREVGTWASVN